MLASRIRNSSGVRRRSNETQHGRGVHDDSPVATGKRRQRFLLEHLANLGPLAHPYAIDLEASKFQQAMRRTVGNGNRTFTSMTCCHVWRS